jgi:hypothetical protein
VAHNLPSQPTPFIGRERELAELAALLVLAIFEHLSGGASLIDEIRHI